MPKYSPINYSLVDLHKEIDLYDRRIAYCQNIAAFQLDSERSREVRKLCQKRRLLANIAVKFSAQGVTHNPKFLPRSFRVDEAGNVTDAAENESDGLGARGRVEQ